MYYHSVHRSQATRAAIAIGLLGFALRALYVWLEWNRDIVDGSLFSGDAITYDTLAREILARGRYWLGDRPTAYVVPGYPLWLAFWYAVVGPNHLIIGLIQSLLGGVTCGLVVLLGARALGVRCGVLAGLACALLPEFLMWTSGQVLTEPLYIFLLTAAVAVLAGALNAPAGIGRPVITGWVLGGALLGMAAITRPTALAFATVVGGYIWLVAGWRRALTLLLAAATFVVPWTARNAVVMDAPIATSTDAGWVLYLYHSPGSPGANGGYDPHVPREPSFAALGEVEQARHYARAAIGFALRNPSRELHLSARRFWNTFRPAYDVASLRNRWLAYLTYVPLVVFGVAGMILTARDPALRLLHIFVLFHVVFHSIVAGELRFRMPIHPALTIFAAVAALRLSGGLRWRPTLLVGAPAPATQPTGTADADQARSAAQTRST